MKNKITQFAVGSVSLIVFALVLISCEVISSTAGVNFTRETVWLRLIPGVPYEEAGIWKAELMLDFSRAIDGLEPDTSEEDLNKIFTFEVDDTETDIRVIRVEKFAEAVYRLTVANVPSTSGVAKVSVDRPNITPPFRLWSFDGQIIPDEEGPSMLSFTFAAGGVNSSLSSGVSGVIDQANGKVAVTLPINTELSNLTPRVTTTQDSEYTPAGAMNFSAPVSYSVSLLSDASKKKNYEITASVQTFSSAAITQFQFRKPENEDMSVSSVAGEINEAERTITVTVPANTDRSSLVPLIAHTGASISPLAIVPRNFSAPVSYTVTALDGNTTVSYEVTVNLEPTYSIMLSYGEDIPLDDTHGYDFLGEPGYEDLTPLTVTIRNTGNQATGHLSAVAADSTRFSLAGSAIDNIEVDGATSFTVQPKSGLKLGAYTSTFTVSGGHNIEAHFTVCFMVAVHFSIDPTISLTPGDSKFSYTITDSEPSADSYDLYWVTGSETDPAVIMAGDKVEVGSNLTGTISGLSNDTTYSVLVVAHKDGYEDGTSEIVLGLPSVGQFSVVPSLALAEGTNQLNYTITASNPAADSYDLYWVTGSETEPAIVTAGAKIEAGQTLSGTITGLAWDTTCSVIVVAHKADYRDSDSEVASGMWTYRIGDTGPAGGKIFYLDTDDNYAGWRYLEAASADVWYAWGAANTDVEGTSWSIGTGKQNTALIIAKNAILGETDKVAQLCAACTQGGYNDWFLPSVEELILIYAQRSIIGGLIGGLNDEVYWTSTQYDSIRAYAHNFANNVYGAVANKTSQYHGRPIRSF
jgi:hypothetical protein